MCLLLNLRRLTFRTAEFDLNTGLVKWVHSSLDTVMHIGPSAISLGSIILSNGRIREIFLRGVGVPEAIIEQIPALIGSLSPIDYYSCFISYSSKDQDFADRVEESIRIYDKLLIVLSENSVRSTWVEYECRAALEKENRFREEQPLDRTVLFPIKLDEAIKGATSQWVCKIRRERHIGDFTRWKNHDDYEKAFSRLLRDLKAEA
jgi:hypothetical protein